MICCTATDNTIGGNSAGERNIISGNSLNGVAIKDVGTYDNVVSGNYIGTNSSGSAVLGNAQAGVFLFNGTRDKIIGGDKKELGNLISGNGLSGVGINGDKTHGNIISANYIGTHKDGNSGLGNEENGVYIFEGAYNNTIGENNLIAFNLEGGVVVMGKESTGNIITRNSIFSNDIGIYLAEGGNDGIPAPSVTGTVEGSVKIMGKACAKCTVEVFDNPDDDGEGETYIGTAAADSNGNFSLTVNALKYGFITATATDKRGTSEFSAVYDALPKVYLPLAMWE